MIAALLAARPERERDRLRQLGIPRSTYYAVRRRAYLEGWLKDRYVPDPAYLGRPYATFVIARPFAERVQDLAQPVLPTGAPTILWASPQLAFAVFFHAGGADADHVVEVWKERRIIASEATVSADIRGPTIPVFFDFEGAWDHMTQVPGTLAYPHGLGGNLPAEAEPPPLTPHTAWALSNLLARPFQLPGGSEDGHQTGVFGLPFSERRLLQRGWVTHRVLLNPSQVPSYPGRAGDRLFFVVGTPRAGGRPDALFGRLTRECRVFPFLYVIGARHWLIGALGGDPSPPNVADDRRDRTPVLATLTQVLEGIQIFQEPLAALSLIADHRYDLLAPKRER